MNFDVNQTRRQGDAGVPPSVWRRINVLDVIFVLVLLVIILAAASFFTPFSVFNLGAEERVISYTVEFKNVDGAMAANIKAGDTAFDAAGKNPIGTVTAVESYPAVRYIYNEQTQTIERTELPADADGNAPMNIRVTVQAVADYTKGRGFSISGNRISVGSPLEICFPGYVGIGSCVAVHVLS